MHTTRFSPSPRTMVMAVLALALPIGAAAQCVGDCDGNGRVAVNELVLGTNIALERAQLSQCPVFDMSGNGSVEVNELVLGVNNALRECPAGTSPTPTQTVTPSVTSTATLSGPTPTPTATNTPIEGCGNGETDFDLGETCDDGNNAEGPGDNCPANCRIATCTASDEQIDVDVNFAPPSGVDLAGVQVFLRYPEGLVRIPGRGNATQVLDRFSNLNDIASYSINDQDYGASVLAFTTGETITPGRLFTTTFDRCSEAPAPTADDFGCRVTDASPPTAGVTCSVTVP
jgi:hypothetical protein